MSMEIPSARQGWLSVWTQFCYNNRQLDFRLYERSGFSVDREACYGWIKQLQRKNGPHAKSTVFANCLCNSLRAIAVDELVLQTSRLCDRVESIVTSAVPKYDDVVLVVHGDLNSRNVWITRAVWDVLVRITTSVQTRFISAVKAEYGNPKPRDKRRILMLAVSDVLYACSPEMMLCEEGIRLANTFGADAKDLQVMLIAPYVSSDAIKQWVDVKWHLWNRYVTVLSHRIVDPLGTEIKNFYKLTQCDDPDVQWKMFEHMMALDAYRNVWNYHSNLHPLVFEHLVERNTCREKEAEEGIEQFDASSGASQRILYASVCYEGELLEEKRQPFDPEDEGLEMTLIYDTTSEPDYRPPLKSLFKSTVWTVTESVRDASGIPLILTLESARNNFQSSISASKSIVGLVCCGVADFLFHPDKSRIGVSTWSTSENVLPKLINWLSGNNETAHFKLLCNLMESQIGWHNNLRVLMKNDDDASKESVKTSIQTHKKRIFDYFKLTTGDEVHATILSMVLSKTIAYKILAGLRNDSTAPMELYFRSEERKLILGLTEWLVRAVIKEKR